MKKFDFTIAICTYQRADILEHCLHSLAKVVECAASFEVLIIDNNSTDHTFQIYRQYALRFPHWRYQSEPQQGLSFARNTAYRVARGTWIVYLDDDAKVFPDFIIQLRRGITQFSYPCFGGWYEAYYLGQRPKWIPATFGTMALPRPDSGQLKTEIVHGGIMILKRSLLEKICGFDTRLGMNGQQLGYGEEEEIQYRIRQSGLDIGFIKELKVLHLVGVHKCRLSWHFKRHYTLHRDKNIILPSRSFRSAGAQLARSVVTTPLKMLFYIFRFRRDDYYYQNYLLDVFSPIWIRVGILTGILRHRTTTSHQTLTHTEKINLHSID